MNSRALMALLVLAASIAVIATALLHASLTAPPEPLATQRVPYLFEVREAVGIDAATDKLRLGAQTPGGRSYRDVNVTHPSASWAGAYIRGKGREMLYADPAEASLVNGTATFRIYLVPPVDAELGTYEGEIVFLFW